MCEGLLPEWAKKRFTGELELGTQLCTRDGRRMGNAHIVDTWMADLRGTQRRFFLVLTDAGTQLTMTRTEIIQCFYQPEYVSDAAEVLAKFQRKD